MSTIRADSANASRATTGTMPAAATGTINLRVKDLRVHFRTVGGTVRAVNDVTFHAHG